MGKGKGSGRVGDSITREQGREGECGGEGERGSWGFDGDSLLTLVIGGARKSLGAGDSVRSREGEREWGRVGEWGSWGFYNRGAGRRGGAGELGFYWDSSLTLVIGGARKSLGAGDSLPSSSQSLFLSTSSWLNCKYKGQGHRRSNIIIIFMNIKTKYRG